MKHKVCSFVFLLVFVISIAGCGAQPQSTPDAAPEPTMVPPSPSPTPIPEPTSTPEPTLVPIDLDVQIQDMQGKPLQAANLQMNDQQAILQSNEKGEINLKALSVDKVKLVIKSPGYKITEKQSELQRGANTVIVQLEDDPLGLKLTDACGEEEKPLYIEDFQDKRAENWPEIDGEAMGWSIREKIDEPGNYMIMAKGNKDNWPPTSDLKSDLVFENAVWRVKVWFTGKTTIDTFLNWRHSFETGDKRYFLHIGPQVQTELIRFDSGNGFAVGRSTLQLQKNKWASIEISTFEGISQVWVNGKKLVEYADKNPLPPGTIGLEPHFNTEGEIYYDNFAVCGLISPFVTRPTLAIPKK